MTTTAYEDETVTNNLASALEVMPDEWVICRDMRHAWEIDRDFHVLSTSQTGVHEIGRVLKCIRCGTHRQEQYVARNGVGLQKLRQSYQYPEGYMIHGVPRGVKPHTVVQQEQYRRAMERATKLTQRTETLPSA